MGAAMPWSQWLAHTLQRPVAAVDRQRAALHLIDWLACAHLGHAGPETAALREWARRCPPGPVWGCGGLRLQAGDAARFHGSLGSVYELDDVHRAAIVHPGDTVVPAALALAQREGCRTSDLLDALVIGYEAGIRLGLLAGVGHYQHWYSTATVGSFASAMACARLLRLPPQAWPHALALAGMQAAGVWQCRMEPGLAKQVATGHSAQAGLAAAELAQAAVTGPLSILEGEHGWLRATGGVPDDEAAQRHLVAAADAPWRMHEVSFKPWPACRHVHPAIACALQAHAQGVRPAQVAQLQVQTYRTALAFADQPQPATPHQARFSLQHAVAWALCHGDFGMSASNKATGLADATCADLRARTSLAVHAEHERDYPQRFGASLQLQLHDGTQRHIRQDHAPGDPEQPLSVAQVCEKALGLLQAAGWTAEKAQTLIDQTLALPDHEDLKPWWLLLHPAGQR